MALTEQGIARAREVVNSESRYTGHDVNFLHNDFYSQVHSYINNEEFIKFAEGTKLGLDFMNKWQELIKLISIEIPENMNSLRSGTRNFLDEQERNNNMRV